MASEVSPSSGTRMVSFDFPSTMQVMAPLCFAPKMLSSYQAITLPITEAWFCINNCGPVRSVNATRDQATSRRCSTTLIALFATLPQIQIECSVLVFVRSDVPIKAFITDFCAVFVVECTTDFLIAPLIVAQVRRGKAKSHAPHPNLLSLFAQQSGAPVKIYDREKTCYA